MATPVRLSGPGNAAEIWRFIEARYCRSLMAPDFAEMRAAYGVDTPSTLAIYRTQTQGAR